MSNKPAVTTPALDPDPQAPDYVVPDPLKAWEQLDRLVSKVISTPKDNIGNNSQQPQNKKTHNT